MTFPSSEQSETMRVALAMACKELGLRATDDVSRASVASAIRSVDHLSFTSLIRSCILARNSAKTSVTAWRPCRRVLPHHPSHLKR